MPPRSRYAEAVAVRAELGRSRTSNSTTRSTRCTTAYGHLHWVHVLNNAALTAYALTASDGDFAHGDLLARSWADGTPTRSARPWVRCAARCPAQDGCRPSGSSRLRNRVASSLPGFDGIGFDELARRTAGGGAAMTGHDVVVRGQREPGPGSPGPADPAPRRDGARHGGHDPRPAARAPTRRSPPRGPVPAPRFVAALGDDDARAPARRRPRRLRRRPLPGPPRSRPERHGDGSWSRADGENSIVVAPGANADLSLLADARGRSIASAQMRCCPARDAVRRRSEAAAAASAGYASCSTPPRRRAARGAARHGRPAGGQRERGPHWRSRGHGPPVAAVGVTGRWSSPWGEGARDPDARTPTSVRTCPGVGADVVDTTGAGDTFTGVPRGRPGGG